MIYGHVTHSAARPWIIFSANARKCIDTQYTNRLFAVSNIIFSETKLAGSNIPPTKSDKTSAFSTKAPMDIGI